MFKFVSFAIQFWTDGGGIMVNVFHIFSAFLLLLTITPTISSSSEKSICFHRDLRFLSTDPRVGRIQRPDSTSGCTATLISRSCVITAGHCNKKFKEVHFNVPLSTFDGKIKPSEPHNIYQVDEHSIVFSEEAKGDDFAVMRLVANEQTGFFPGDIQGHYPVYVGPIDIGSHIRVIGYGADRDEGQKERNYAQQTSFADIKEVEGSYITYQADTWGGSSGSPVVSIYDRIIAIHTHGDCDETGGRNSGTLVSSNRDLQVAIISCLQWEKQNL